MRLGVSIRCCSACWPGRGPPPKPPGSRRAPAATPAAVSPPTVTARRLCRAPLHCLCLWSWSSATTSHQVLPASSPHTSAAGGPPPLSPRVARPQDDAPGGGRSLAARSWSLAAVALTPRRPRVAFSFTRADSFPPPPMFNNVPKTYPSRSTGGAAPMPSSLAGAPPMSLPSRAPPKAPSRPKPPAPSAAKPAVPHRRALATRPPRPPAPPVVAGRHHDRRARAAAVATRPPRRPRRPRRPNVADTAERKPPPRPTASKPPARADVPGRAPPPRPPGRAGGGGALAPRPTASGSGDDLSGLSVEEIDAKIATAKAEMAKGDGRHAV
jgi:hypothetical protein